MRATCRVVDLGLIEFDRAYSMQRQAVQRAIEEEEEAVFLCEHPPVLTMGRAADDRHIFLTEAQLLRKGIKVYRIDRGGEVTLHAPGQLVVYVILDLSRRGRDLRRYLRDLESVIMDFLVCFGVTGKRLEDKTGVFVSDAKIASIGIGVRRWISFHGLAVNITTDLSLFSLIRPCGLDVKMTSLQALTGPLPSQPEMKEKLLNCLSSGLNMKTFGDNLHERDQIA